MKLDVKIDLDNLFGWEDNSVSTIILEELKSAIRKEIANSIKNDPKLKQLIKSMQELAVQRAIRELSKQI